MKRITLILIVFFLIQLSWLKGLTQNDTVFYDSFDDNRNEWLVSDSEYSYSDITGGLFTIERKVKGNSLRDQYVFFDRNADFYIETKFIVEDAGEYGIAGGGRYAVERDVSR